LLVWIFASEGWNFDTTFPMSNVELGLILTFIQWQTL